MSRHKQNLLQMMVASCNCLTKTPVVEYHSPACRYRQLDEAVAYIEKLEARVKDLEDYYEGDKPR
jgi:hypothetical protein